MFNSLGTWIKKHGDLIWVIFFLTVISTILVMAIFYAMQIIKKDRNEIGRVRALVNKAGVVVIHDKKLDVRTISHYASGYFICRIDYGPDAVPRFAEVKFHESEIKFTEPVEGK